MKRIYFDIETGPQPDSVKQFDPMQVLIGNLKDPDKITAKIDEARVKFVENAALSPLTGIVIAAGVVRETGPTEVWTGDELSTIGFIVDHIRDALHEGRQVCGFNCFSFDLPFLLKRAWSYGINGWSNTLRKGRYWADGLVDLREVWQMGDRQAPGSLDAIGKFMGFGGKAGEGAEFADLLKRDRDAAIAYLERDLVLTRSIGERMLGL